MNDLLPLGSLEMRRVTATEIAEDFDRNGFSRYLLASDTATHGAFIKRVVHTPEGTLALEVQFHDGPNMVAANPTATFIVFDVFGGAEASGKDEDGDEAMTVPQDALAVARAVARSGVGSDPGAETYIGALRQEGFEDGLAHLLEYLAVAPDPTAAINELRDILGDRDEDPNYIPLIQARQRALDQLAQLPRPDKEARQVLTTLAERYPSEVRLDESLFDVLIGLIGDRQISEAVNEAREGR